MRRKYDRLAAEWAALRLEIDKTRDPFGAIYTFRSMLNAYCTIERADNPNFDPGRFRRACYALVDTDRD